MPKLLQINSCANTGSTGRIAEEIGQLAIQHGWESYIAYARSSAKSKSRLYKIGDKLDFIIHALQTRLFDRHGLASTKATHCLISQINEIKPDIIHLHNIHGYYLNYPILFEYLAKSKIPVVWTLHDCWAFTGHCAYFSFAKCNRWKTACFNCPQKSSYPKSLLIDRSLKNYSEKNRCFNSLTNLTLVPISDWLGDIVGKSFLSKNLIHRIYNGVNVDVFKPISVVDNVGSKYKTGNEILLLGVANIWSSRKGLADFIKLRKQLDSNHAILLVGLLKEQIRALPPGIIGLERTDSAEELATLYSIADLFINPTYEDNFPTTNLESMACGTPVLTYRTGGSIEAITPETGFIVEQGDIAGIVKVVQKIRETGKAKYTIACRQRVLNCFRKEDRFAEYIELYNKLVNK